MVPAKDIHAIVIEVLWSRVRRPDRRRLFIAPSAMPAVVDAVMDGQRRDDDLMDTLVDAIEPYAEPWPRQEHAHG